MWTMQKRHRRQRAFYTRLYCAGRNATKAHPIAVRNSTRAERQKNRAPAMHSRLFTSGSDRNNTTIKRPSAADRTNQQRSPLWSAHTKNTDPACSKELNNNNDTRWGTPTEKQNHANILENQIKFTCYWKTPFRTFLTWPKVGNSHLTSTYNFTTFYKLFNDTRWGTPTRCQHVSFYFLSEFYQF